MADDHVKRCECGCGTPTKQIRHTVRAYGRVAGQYYRFLPGHHARLKPCPPTTYVSRSTGSYTRRALHLVRAEAALGHPLPPKAIVHHVDEDPSNPNARLVICPNQKYHFLLHVRMRVKQAGGDPNRDRICAYCGVVKPMSEFVQYKSAAVWHCKPCKCQHVKASAQRVKSDETFTR